MTSILRDTNPRPPSLELTALSVLATYLNCRLSLLSTESLSSLGFKDCIFQRITAARPRRGGRCRRERRTEWTWSFSKAQRFTFSNTNFRKAKTTTNPTRSRKQQKLFRLFLESETISGPMQPKPKNEESWPKFFWRTWSWALKDLMHRRKQLSAPDVRRWRCCCSAFCQQFKNFALYSY